MVYAWPASVQPWRYVWGSHGDALGNAYEYTWAAATLHAGQPLAINHQTAWPFGDALGSIPHDPLFWWVTIGLSYVIGAVSALNILSLIAIPLGSWVMYRLALRITSVPPAAFVAGIAFGCSTFVLQNTRGEPTLVQVWVFPLEVLALTSLLSRPRLLSVVAAGVAVAVAATVDFYYALFSAVVAMVFVGSWLALKLLLERRLPWQALAGAAAAAAIAAALSGALYVATFGSLKAQADQIRRPAAQLTVLGVTPLDFVLPARSNPWLGAPRMALVAERLQQTGSVVDLSEVEVALPILVLAPLGLIFLVRGIAPARRPVNDPRLVAAMALVAVSLIALWLMIPPDALSRRSLALQWDVYRIAPQFQAYHRAIILVQLGALVLAATALARFLPARTLATIPIVAALCAVIMMENLVWPADRALALTTPPEYSWIEAHPGDYAIAEYPLFTNDAGGNEWTYDFNTRFHSHPIINGHISDNESASMRVELEDPNRPGVAEALSTLGVRYVIWHQDLAGVPTTYGPVLPHTDAADRPTIDAYGPEATFSDGATVYSVRAAAGPAFAFYAAGFSGIDQASGSSAGRWMTGPHAQIDVYRPAGASSGTLTFSCSAAASGASLAMFDETGSLGDWTIAQIPTAVTATVGMRPGINRIRMVLTSPAPESSSGWARCSLPSAQAA